MIVFNKLTQIAAKAAENIDRRRTTKEGYLVKLVGGPLNNEVRRLEHLKRLIVFTTPAGAYEYVRISKSDILTKYRHLTKDLEDELEFAQEMEKLAVLDDTNFVCRWNLRVKYNPEVVEKLREYGFRWDHESREWYIIGTGSFLREALDFAANLPESSLICEPHQG